MAKRLFDIFCSLFALLAAAPVLALLWLAVAASMGRPVLFWQRRVGRGGAEFEVGKFRSMREAYDANGQPLPDEERVTRVGRLLRRLRLDELPQFWFILTGRMSFVGPRPLPRSVLEPTGLLERRSRVRPGMTGLAQVSGNTLLSNEEKIAIDVLYGDTASLLLDIRILFKTLWVVVGGERRDPRIIEKALAHAQHAHRRGR